MRRAMSSVWVVAMATILAWASGCSPPPEHRCEERRPDGYGRTCEGDGACSGYLKCLDGECRLPPTMTGVGESTSVQVSVVPDENAQPVVVFEAEYAATELERSRGLSGRPCMQSGWAMLFVYPEPQNVVFQSRDMVYDLDLAFASEDGEVVALHRKVPAGSADEIKSSQPVRYVLEARAGDLDSVSEGDLLRW